ncbi:MAG: hypothetical protein ACRDTA_19490 [Pseudonocardiaceae bacterium]
MFLAPTGVGSFRDFVRRYSPNLSRHFSSSPHPPPFSSLSHYIAAWLQSGEAPKECVGSFSIYLQTVILIIIEWQRDPHLLDFRGDDGSVFARQVEVVDDSPRDDHNYDWIDREYFAYFNYPVDPAHMKKMWGI